MAEDMKKEPMVIFQPAGRRGYVRKGITIKQASRELGVDIEGLCSEVATCGKCRVRIEKGSLSKQSDESRMGNLDEINEAEKKLLSPQEQQDGYRLACQAHIQGDVVVFVPEESRMDKQVIRKAAKEISTALKPAVRK